MDPSDNVATVVESARTGDHVMAGDATVVAAEAIEAGHKIALQLIPQGESVVKYGEVIGLATQEIAAGAWVHTHNLVSPPRSRAGALGPGPTGNRD
jgi:altronate dehydratase